MVTNNINKPGHRMTTQRVKILEYLRSVKTHPTAEIVYNAVKSDLPTISLGTVYRNLNILAEQGKILKVNINNEAHFDGDVCNHQHFVCTKCKKVIDILQGEITEYVMNKVKCNGFTPICVTIKYAGYCNKCDNRGGK